MRRARDKHTAGLFKTFYRNVERAGEILGHCIDLRLRAAGHTEGFLVLPEKI
ncbi:MAG: hypothetical protein JRH18_24640 [Deltaproteobacteria bacterium]|nr:hypothetical protein [Deltaproteobacteria bacterium]